MARIRNSSTKNAHGDGYEQILTTDDGKSYRIKNSSSNYVYGSGKEKVIVENKSSGDDIADGIADWLLNSSPKFIRVPINILCTVLIFAILGVVIYGILQVIFGMFQVMFE